MPTVKLTIGTTAIPVLMLDPNKVDVAKVILQNLGATDLYWGHDENVTTANGHLLAPNGVFIDEMELEPVWVISNAVSGDLRITVERYIKNDVLRIVE